MRAEIGACSCQRQRHPPITPSLPPMAPAMWTLLNVAFGDVYLCSGQSNMMIVLNYSFGGPEAAARASHYPNIRLFNIFMQYDSQPRNETGVSYSPDSWVLPAADTLQNSDNWQDVFSYFSGVCYWTAMHLYDSMNGSVPLGLVHSSWGGTCVQAWTSADAVGRCGPLLTPGLNTSQNQPSVLYNAMIHPLLPMRLAAVMWYQGESDDFDVDRYGCSFPNMITDWRSKFGYPELPFYFALLAPYAPEADAFVGLRESQMQALQLADVGVVNTIDLGDASAWQGSVHPRNKSYVGERFARWLRRDIYDEQVAVAGPQPETVRARVSGKAQQLVITVTFKADSSHGLFALPTPDCANSTGGFGCCVVTGDSVDGGLVAFGYATKSGNFTGSGAVTIDRSARTLTLTASGGNLPTAGQWVTVSHAWQGFPGCALYNEHRLPALPFRVNVTVEGMLGATPLRLNNFFSNDMVLQRAPQQAVVWGYGEPGRTITVQLDSEPVISTIVSAAGSWNVKLPAQQASFNRILNVSDAETNVALSNVAFGDVYLCSGQSNMQITLNYSFGGPEAMLDSSQYSNIRLFGYYQTNNSVALDEQPNVWYGPYTWVLPSRRTLQLLSQPDNPWAYFPGTCYWAGKYISDSLNNSMPIGLVGSSYGGTIVEAWTSPDTNTKCGPITSPAPNGFPNDPSSVYNAMIHPLLPARFAAVLWYQGESDQYDINRYKCSFPNMIQDWRSQFQITDLPFYFVLLSPYAGIDPLLRQAQLAAWPGTNVGVASAIDLGDKYGSTGDIHPRNKSFVGERLARWVRRDIYGQQLNPLGPEPLNDPNAISVTVASVANNTVATVVLTYRVVDANSGLFMLPSPDCTTCCQGGAGPLLITISDSSSANGSAGNAQYRPVVAVNHTEYTVTATFNLPYTPSADATAIVGLEAESWPQCVLYNRHNLPALPFITTVPIHGGGSKGEEGTSAWVYVIAVVVVLAVVGVVAWLVVRYMRQRRASAEAEAGGYRDIDATARIC